MIREDIQQGMESVSYSLRWTQWLEITGSLMQHQQ